MASEPTAETGNSENRFFRKPYLFLWIGTWVVIIFAIWSLLLLLLTASGHLLSSQNLGCQNSEEDFVESRLKHEAWLVYLWSGVSLPVCLLLLLEFWRKKGFYALMIVVASTVLSVMMFVSFSYFVKEETQAIAEFQKHYTNLSLRHLKDSPANIQKQPPETTCHVLSKVHSWQTVFKCCGLRGHQDWGSSIPDSCLCDGQDNSSGCVGVGHSFVYEKPCLPTVFSLVEKRSTTFWAVMIVWISVPGFSVAIFALLLGFGCSYCCYTMFCEPACYTLNVCMYKLRGGEDMVPVVFIRQSNNNQPEEEGGKEKESDKDGGVALDVEGRANQEGRDEVEDYIDDNPVIMIPLSALKRLQEELDPPPVRHQVRCLCISPSKPRDFYTVPIEEGSPLLPSGAVLVDADKPTRDCLWVEGPHLFCVEHLVWPRESTRNSNPLLL